MDRLVQTALRLVEMLVCSLPPRSVPVLAWVGGSLWYAVDGRRRRRCRANLRAAFGADSPHTSEATVRAIFRNMAHVPLEALWFPRMYPNRRVGLTRVDVVGDFDAFEACAEQGGLMLGGHLGNWELGAHALRVYPLPVSVVVRPFVQPGLERRLAASRGGDEAVIPHRDALAGIKAALASNRWVGVVGDQNAGWKGPFVPFFGLPASTAGAVVLLAMKANAPIFVGGVIRNDKPFHFTLHLARLHPPPLQDDRRAAVRSVLEQYMTCLERFIRLAPAQYNWLHRRWKSRPPGEAPDDRLPVYDHHRPQPAD